MCWPNNICHSAAVTFLGKYTTLSIIFAAVQDHLINKLFSIWVLVLV